MPPIRKCAATVSCPPPLTDQTTQGRDLKFGEELWHVITLGLIQAIFDNPIRSWDIWIKVLFQTNFAKSVFSQFFSNFLNISAPRLWIKNRLDESSSILIRCVHTKFERPGSSRSGCKGGWVWKSGCTFTKRRPPVVFIQTAFRAFFEHHLHSFSGQVATVHYCRVNNNNHQLGERLSIPNLSFPAKITFVSWI